MAENIPTQIAETIQTAHIQRDPSPRHDLNPSSSLSEKQPVHLQERHSIDSDLDDYEEADDDESEIPISVLKPHPRSRNLPPMPDLRFEQSYLHSIAKADTWWKVAWITVRDQMMMPFAQGVLYNLALHGWHHWNKNARISGTSVGARLRRWWYGVNNWPLPSQKMAGASAKVKARA
ncbi:hypothetical protein GL218_01171 [Daldinia childiae]|uniref:uncharacterized protein n=1 Tax=Daldinia childiae TaxID=326645 RepID=UPI001444EF9F|nr:uncharacterized protein GL218_01171 [Daldinia childiae]KAF3064565.1 hypothetical protein GL218_01171 [Daldinia childiae]